jgi:eukaryotic-like serine/threonine-protein kinase
MTPERWAEVNDVLHRAMQLAREDRPAFLESACASDSSLRHEVESLLAADEHARSGFLESRPGAGLAKGSRLGDYEIQSLLGAGGMGEVYRARDLRLRREVAIKVLPAFFSWDPERLRRFEQEAMAAAVLNHPNILAVYQMGAAPGGAPYLVSELLKGETLREQIKRGRIMLRRAIDYGVQVTRGLAAAHEKGIVHRDLKPENLFVTKDGRVKILDFGLAKLSQPHSGSADDALTVGSETEPGMVMGTAGYMSPEQVRGESADHRADIFSFGAILYEMLTGQRAFQWPTSAETMAAILNEEPAAISQITPQIPAALQRIVLRCLEKNPEQRFQSPSDLAFALEALSDSGVLSASMIAGKGIAARSNRYLKFILVPAVILAIGFTMVGISRWRSAKSGTLAERDTIVLADFANSTTDPVFDDTLKEALTVSLQQTPFLNILSDEKVQSTLKLMGRPADQRLTPAIAREICQRTSSQAFLHGSISRLGDQYVLGVKAINCVTGETLTQEQKQATRKEDVLKVLSVESVNIRTNLGESLSTVQKYATPIEEATTPSLDALKAFSLGARTWAGKGELAAIPYYKRAIELDPSFAGAYAQLGSIYVTDLLDPTIGADYVRKAYELRDHVNERERLNITERYYAFVTGELEKAAQTYEFYAQTYPNDYFAHSTAGLMYQYLGQYENAAAHQRESIRTNPDYVSAYSNLMVDLLALNRAGEALGVYRQAMDRKLDGSFIHDGRYIVAFLQSDSDEMQRQVALAMGKPGSEDDMFSVESDTEAFHGRWVKGRQLAGQASASAFRAGETETAALWQLYSALVDAEFGYTERSRKAVSASAALASTRDTQILAALTLSRVGEEKQAQALADHLAKQFPLNTALNGYWLPAIRAYLAIRSGHPSQAVTQLEVSTPYELGFPPPQVGPGGFLYPAFIRGQAYLRLQRGTEAAGEFRKLLDHSGMLGNSPLYPLAHLYLARAYALQADKGNAGEHYAEFLTLWKDADPDIPLLKQAKAEYAKLQ